VKTARRTGRWKDRVRELGRDPGSDRQRNLIHHGFRALVVFAIATGIPLMFPRTPLPDFVSLEEGAVADQDVIATVSFAVTKSSAQLEAERLAAEQSVTPVFTLKAHAADSSAARVRAFFARLDSAFAEPGLGPEEAISRTLAGIDLQPTPEQVVYLQSQSNRAALRRSLERAYQSLLGTGVVRGADLENLTSPQVVVTDGETQRSMARDSLVTLGRFYAQASRLAPANASVSGVALFQTLLIRFAEPSLTLDRAKTIAAREQARSAVQPTTGNVLEGERIVTAHERVGRAEIEKLQAYRTALLDSGFGSEGANLLGLLGSILYALIPLGLLAVVMHFFWPGVYTDLRGFLIVLLLAPVILAIASAISHTSTPASLVTLIPIAIAGLLIGALYDGLLALFLVLAIAIIIAGQPPFSGLSSAVLLLSAGAAASLGVRGVHRRAQSWVLIALITGAYLLAGIALVLMRVEQSPELVEIVFWGLLSAIASTVLVVAALLPAMERLTGITTDQTLLELTDLNRPLLRQLSREAPGTYAHSIAVGNLTEAGCQAIGANALLARAGCHYHDIGKMAQPQYFIENQAKGRNPHDKLSPSRSAAVIREHIREGLHLATEANLPQVIKDFIAEHHGTMTISFFLDKAREEEPDVDINPSNFAYPGPKPQSRETAIAMLADGIESATRVLPDPAPDRIREVIEEIVRSRLETGQLDQCPLTLREIDTVKAQFARVLIGMYHHRVAYPTGVGATSMEPESESRPAATEENRPPREATRSVG
jgi:putative nucleotidyltransferase with HDIG domain